MFYNQMWNLFETNDSINYIKKIKKESYIILTFSQLFNLIIIKNM